MTIGYDEIENAFCFVSMSPKFMHSAIISLETGKIYYISELGDFDELPDDYEDFEKYIGIPHKNDLDLGIDLVLEFVSESLPEHFAEVREIFHHKGAYTRFKGLLRSKGLLEKWYRFENERTESALREWCAENGLQVSTKKDK
jgi:hypothetical protein